MGWKAVKDHYRIEHIVQIVPSKGICIGSPYVHDILVVDAEAGVRRNAAFTLNGELERYKTEMDADPAALKVLVALADVFVRSLPVFTYDGAEILECRCEEYGWPNVTHDGRMMFENSFSADRAEVVRWAVENARAGIENCAELVATRESELTEARDRLATRHARLITLLTREFYHG
jgi:hypothetical protein